MKLKKPIIKYLHNLKTLARINSKTKEIEVLPRFQALSGKMKDIIILNLHFLAESNEDAFVVDEKTLKKITLKKIIELYPETNNYIWIKNSATVLFYEKPNNFNLKRIERLSLLNTKKIQ